LEERRLQGSWALRRALTLAGESDWDMVAGQRVGTSKQRQAKHGHGRRDETSPCATPKTTTLPHANLDGRAHIVSPLRRGAPSSSTPCVPLHGSALPRRSLLLRCSPGLIAVELRPHNNITAVTPPSHRIASAAHHAAPNTGIVSPHADRIPLLLLSRTDTAGVSKRGNKRPRGSIAIALTHRHRCFNLPNSSPPSPVIPGCCYPDSVYKYCFARLILAPPRSPLRQIL
jgi:hypothetical protein